VSVFRGIHATREGRYTVTVATSASRFTREEYMALPESYPAQLIEGFLVHDPSPVTGHQILVTRLLLAMARHVGEERVLVAPHDVFLDGENIYQPDLMVYEREVEFRPDGRTFERPVLVVEVLSRSTARYDLGVKSRRYLEWGVGEVWLVDPDDRTVEVRTREGSLLREVGDVAESTAVRGLRVDLARLFRT
jgi:Uma2 family endonuclease